MEHGGLAHARDLPRRHVAEACVVALRLPLGRLILLAEVTTARLLAVERVVTHQLGELEEVRDTTGMLQRLIEILAPTPDIHVAPELLAHGADPLQRRRQPGRGAR